MRFRELIVICLAVMMALGSFAFTYADTKPSDIYVTIYVTVVDKEGQPVEGVIMNLTSSSPKWLETTDENGQVMYGVPPGQLYKLQELGYKDEGIVYNELNFRMSYKLQKTDYWGDAEYELDEIGRITWTKGDYENRSAVRVVVDADRFNGSRVELINAAGDRVGTWTLKEEGDLIANVQPGSYTLREIIELNGYEIPVNSHIMVGSGNLVPVKPDEVPEPEAQFVPDNPEPLPSYYYDEFQKWLDGLK